MHAKARQWEHGNFWDSIYTAIMTVRNVERYVDMSRSIEMPYKGLTAAEMGNLPVLAILEVDMRTTRTHYRTNYKNVGAAHLDSWSYSGQQGELRLLNGDGSKCSTVDGEHDKHCGSRTRIVDTNTLRLGDIHFSRHGPSMHGYLGQAIKKYEAHNLPVYGNYEEQSESPLSLSVRLHAELWANIKARGEDYAKLQDKVIIITQLMRTESASSVKLRVGGGSSQQSH